MASRIEITHRGYGIVSGLIGGKPAAQVHIGRARATSERFEGGTVEEAANAALAWVDARRAEAARNRRLPNTGTVEEYVAYFSANALAEHHRAMLVAHAAAPDRTMPTGQLAKAAGWPDFSTANLHYGTLGGWVADAIELELLKHPDGDLSLISALAMPAGEGWKPVDGLFLWRMHEELAEALTCLNIR